MTPPPTVVFDCDGVLVDSKRLSHTVLQQMLAAYGRERSLQQTQDHFTGTSTEKCLAVLAGLIGRPAPPSFMDDFRDRTFEPFGASLEPIRGVRVFGYAVMGQQDKLRAAGVDLVFDDMAPLPRLLDAVRS